MRRRDRRDATAWLGSALVHGTIVAVAWLTAAVEPRPLEYQTFDIHMVESVPEEELVVETPDPTPPPEDVQEEPEPPPVVEEAPEPEPEPPEPEEEEEPEPEPPEERPEPTPTPENIDVRMEGLQRDFPEYYGNIVFQMRRCFRWTRSGASWRATIDFVIEKDGGIPPRDIDISRSSGNIDFDLAAVEAVECAGDKLGPLPDDLRLERLPVRFNFTPPGGDTDVAPGA